jgi:hypothetical protein
MSWIQYIAYFESLNLYLLITIQYINCKRLHTPFYIKKIV